MLALALPHACPGFASGAPERLDSWEGVAARLTPVCAEAEEEKLWLWSPVAFIAPLPLVLRGCLITNSSRARCAAAFRSTSAVLKAQCPVPAAAGVDATGSGGLVCSRDAAVAGAGAVAGADAGAGAGADAAFAATAFRLASPTAAAADFCERAPS